MSKILRISESDYRIKVQDGGNITLDVGLDPNLDYRGTVTITGNLDVIGKTTTVESSNTSIKDNIIVLNSGETGSGVVTLGTKSGLQIDRGLLDDAQFVWNELTDKFVFQTTTGSSATLTGITVGNIATNPGSNLEIDMQGGSGVLRIVNSSGYTAAVIAQVTLGDTGVIPNVQYLNDYVSAGVVVTGQADVDRIYKGHLTNPVLPYNSLTNPIIIDTQAVATGTSLEFFVGGADVSNIRANITASGFKVDNIKLFGNTISNTVGNANLIITALSNYVEVNSVLDLIDQSIDPSPSSGKSRLYSKTAGVGRTGLFFTNNTAYGNANNSTDELVAKNRALLFSMIF